MDPTQMPPRDVILYAVAINAAIGLLLGLIPLASGFIKGNRRLGIIGFVASAVGGALLGIILSIPAVIIFTWLIFGRTKENSGDNA